MATSAPDREQTAEILGRDHIDLVATSFTAVGYPPRCIASIWRQAALISDRRWAAEPRARIRLREPLFCAGVLRFLTGFGIGDQRCSHPSPDNDSIHMLICTTAT